MISGAHGQAMGECLRITPPPSLIAQVHEDEPLVVTRVTCDERNHGMSAAIPPQDAYIVSLQLRDFLSHELWLAGRSVKAAPSKQGTTTFLDLNQEPTAFLRDPFDSLHFYIPRRTFDMLAEEHERPGGTSLHVQHGVAAEDAVVRSLGAALLPALERPNQVSRLFLEHVALALLTHLAEKYGETKLSGSRRPPGLAPWQERRVKELLLSHLDGDVSLDQLSWECGISRSHLCKSFKRSTGQSPHQWLLRRRLAVLGDEERVEYALMGHGFKGGA